MQNEDFLKNKLKIHFISPFIWILLMRILLFIRPIESVFSVVINL